MTNLADLQARMLRAIVSDPAGGLTLMAKPLAGSKEDRLAVYQNAYRQRLTEFLVADYEKLRTYMGAVRFAELASRYIATHPSDHPNARWFSRHLPEFLKASQHYRRQPELAELAQLERAINDAFDGPDHPIVTMSQLASMASDNFASACLVIPPSLHRFAVSTNVASLWSSLKCGETPPAPLDLAEPSEIMVWRQGSGSRFRILGAEEAMAIDNARAGQSFGLICEMIAVFDDPEAAELRAATYLRGWIEAGIIAGIQLPGTAEK